MAHILATTIVPPRQELPDVMLRSMKARLPDIPIESANKLLHDYLFVRRWFEISDTAPKAVKKLRAYKVQAKAIRNNLAAAKAFLINLRTDHTFKTARDLAPYWTQCSEDHPEEMYPAGAPQPSDCTDDNIIRLLHQLDEAIVQMQALALYRIFDCGIMTFKSPRKEKTALQALVHGAADLAFRNGKIVSDKTNGTVVMLVDIIREAVEGAPTTEKGRDNRGLVRDGLKNWIQPVPEAYPNPE